MEFKGTKGNWRYSVEHECITTSEPGIVEGSKTICQIKQSPSFDYTGEEAKANAQLIASAPKLLEALDEMVIMFKALLSDSGNPNKPEDFNCINKAELAIKNALGQSI